MWHDSVCNTVQKPTATSIIVAKKATTWGESGFPSEFLGLMMFFTPPTLAIFAPPVVLQIIRMRRGKRK